MCRVRTPLDLPVHSHSGQFRVEERSGRELETGAAASSVGAAGNDVFLKWVFIFLPTNKKTNPLCTFVMCLARLAALARVFPQMLQEKVGALMLHSSRAALRLELLLRRDLAEFIAEDDDGEDGKVEVEVDEDGSDVRQLQAPSQEQVFRGRVPHSCMCCFRVEADLKDFWQYGHSLATSVSVLPCLAFL